MIQKAWPVYRSTGVPGFLDIIRDDPSRVRARKFAQEVDVRFAAAACTIETSEGPVHARPGDAILTGTSGEHWPVSSAHFAQKYEPIPPTVSAEPGRYRSKRCHVLALRMRESFYVVLTDGVSQLTGRSGDWLVDYGDGSLGIVAPPIFEQAYEIVG